MVENAVEPVEINYDDLLQGMECCSFNSNGENLAYVHVKTGKVYCNFGDLGPDPDLPEDWELSDEYIDIPDKRTLNLGSSLVFDFASEVIPKHYDNISAIFRKRGAYGRFKNFLAEHDALEKWYEFEARATETALREWAEENGFRVSSCTAPNT